MTLILTKMADCYVIIQFVLLSIVLLHMKSNGYYSPLCFSDYKLQAFKKNPAPSPRSAKSFYKNPSFKKPNVLCVSLALLCSRFLVPAERLSTGINEGWALKQCSVWPGWMSPAIEPALPRSQVSSPWQRCCCGKLQLQYIYIHHMWVIQTLPQYAVQYFRFGEILTPCLMRITPECTSSKCWKVMSVIYMFVYNNQCFFLSLTVLLLSHFCSTAALYRWVVLVCV